MAGHHRLRGRTRTWKLFAVPGPLGAEVEGVVSWEVGEAMCSRREAVRLHEAKTGRCLGFRRCCPLPEKKTKLVGVIQSVEAALTREEVELIAGQAFLDGKSRTMSCGVQTRQGAVIAMRRDAEGYGDADVVEEAVAKLAAFAPVYRA